MPNWVYNTLYITGDTADLARVREQLNAPFEHTFLDFDYYMDDEGRRKVRTDADGNIVKVPQTNHYHNPVFSFWNIIKPTDIDAYWGEPTRNDVTTNGEFDSAKFSAEFVRSVAEDNDWWHWNVRNWGTKWDVAVPDETQYAETTLEVWDDGTLVYRMNTAWSPPEDAIRTLSEQYPNLHFELSYEEEQGWGGAICFVNGSGTITDEYDIPSCHQDFEDRGQECWACLMYENEEDHLFDDCPRQTLDNPAVNQV